jgi:hypothetical protein
MKVFKITSVVIGAVILTTLAIDATDTLSGQGGSLLAGLIGLEKEFCPAGMIHVPAALTYTCVDAYEATTGVRCTSASPSNEFDTKLNLARSDCQPDSKEGEPWRYINREQAAIACIRAGKRLPSAAEWYQFSMGTPTEECNINSNSIANVGKENKCISAAGVFNAVGNVWEWVADDVISGVYKERTLPSTGAVLQVDSDGVATVTSFEEVSTDGYLWTNYDGAYGMIRGGYYGSKEDAGIYTIHAHTLPTFLGAAVGFRCVK